MHFAIFSYSILQKYANPKIMNYVFFPLDLKYCSLVRNRIFQARSIREGGCDPLTFFHCKHIKMIYHSVASPTHFLENVKYLNEKINSGMNLYYAIIPPTPSSTDQNFDDYGNFFKKIYFYYYQCIIIIIIITTIYLFSFLRFYG